MSIGVRSTWKRSELVVCPFVPPPLLLQSRTGRVRSTGPDVVLWLRLGGELRQQPYLIRERQEQVRLGRWYPCCRNHVGEQQHQRPHTKNNTKRFFLLSFVLERLSYIAPATV